MTQIAFTRATKKQAKARIALEGPSGSGKTYTSLLTAKVLGERVAVIDTEHGSASKYADEFEFDTLPLDRYDPNLLIHALSAAAAGGYEVVVVDSLSHFWMGADGMLEQVDKATKRAGRADSFSSGWKDMAPVERRMIEAMLAYPGHVIVTMRQKSEWVIEENDRGKKVPRKIGMKAVQRDGIEFEFDVVGDLDTDNELVISKSRCKALSGQVIRKPDEEFGRTILAWLTDGVASGPTAMQIRDEAIQDGATYEDLRALYERAQKLAMLGAAVPDKAGDATTLAELIMSLGKTAAAKAARAAQQGDTPPAADMQRKRMFALFAKTDIDDRDEQLAFINAAIDGPGVTSRGSLTPEQYTQVCEALQAAIDEPNTEAAA